MDGKYSVRFDPNMKGTTRGSSSLETERFSAKYQYSVFETPEGREEKINLDRGRTTEENIRQIGQRKRHVRLSPMASALIQRRSGVFLPPTHFATAKKETRILSPACTLSLIHI